MKRFFTFLMICSLIFSLAIPTFAASEDIINLDDVQTEMEKYLQDTELPFEVDDFSVSFRTDVDLSQYSDEEISDLLKEDIVRMKAALSTVECRFTAKPQPRLSNNGGGEYTAEVWAGVPAVGWSTVKQDFKASISGGKIKSIEFLGDGYMDGVSWGQYNHIRSWYELYSNDTKVDINIKGNINYLFNLVNSNYTATFLEELQVSGSVLERQW